MPQRFEGTDIWRSTLAARGPNDANAIARERLRASFLGSRERAGLLAGEIHRALPDYTVHDLSHLDALWDLAGLIAGPAISLTPAESFVLGVSFLLHDLGMALASYRGGLADLKKDKLWRDLVSRHFVAQFGRRPTAHEIENPVREVQDLVVAELLRELHAKHSETLALVSWCLDHDDHEYFIIEDADLRQSFGRVIGRISHSHWWSPERVDAEFTRSIGAPHWAPRDWTVDPLKLACLLRLADVAHIDGSRAPAFLRRLRRPAHASDTHWSFQEVLQKPIVSDDAFVFTSGHAFAFRQAPAWWLCFETLGQIDRELRMVDALLADRNLSRFAVKRVAGIESPERLVGYIPTDGWMPVNAVIHVGDIPQLIKTLGGEELYGRNMRVPLRELIQNATDAVRARRIVERRTQDWGEVQVLLGCDENRHWLEVSDSGIGMSHEVLTRYLLDFATSYWGSRLMITDFPGLLTDGFEATGKYGIGFFSVFMLGDAVKVITRRSEAARNQTLVLEFSTGVSGRPILRTAEEHEQLRDGGTVVRVWLRSPPHDHVGLLRTWKGSHRTLAQVCGEVAPALDVRLSSRQNGSNTTVVLPEDWTSIPADELLQRTQSFLQPLRDDINDQKAMDALTSVASRIRPLRGGAELYGRAALEIDTLEQEDDELYGIVTVGGLAASRLQCIAGVTPVQISAG